MANPERTARYFDLSDPDLDIAAVTRTIVADATAAPDPEVVRTNLENVIHGLVDAVRQMSFECRAKDEKTARVEHENKLLAGAWTGDGDKVPFGTTLEAQHDGLLEILRMVQQKTQTGMLARVVLIWLEGNVPFVRMVGRRPPLIRGV